VDWGATGWDETYGSGLVKADDALRLLDPPYRLFHEAAHQFTYEDLGVRQQWFMNIDDLTTEEDLWQEFRARVYRLRIDAPFPGAGSGADPIQGVWGRGVGSMGARDLDSLDARFWAPYVAVDSATVTPRGCTLETYTYKVYDAAGRVFKCWYPVPIGAGLVCSAPPWGTPTFLYSYVADTTGAGRVAPPGSLPESDGEKRGRAEQPSMVTFELARPGVGSVIVHNVFGREVRGLAREIYLSRGTHSYKWDGKDSAGRLVPSGVYFISLRCGPENTVRRVCVIH
jgi:hypothetical protein